MSSVATKEAETNWIKAFQQLMTDGAWKRTDEQSSKRYLLKKLYDFMDSSDINIINAFDGLSEVDLSREVRLDKTNEIVNFVGSRKSKIENWVCLAGRVLRSLDYSLFFSSETVLVDAPGCWLLPDRSAYIVPLRRNVLKQGGPTKGQSFSRRGLLYHRVIPTDVRGIEVRLSVHPDCEVRGRSSADADPGGRRMGAALFADMELSVEHPEEGRFLVTGVRCDGGVSAALDAHCNEIRTRKCDTVVWPELTMEPSSVRHLSRSLSGDPLDTPLPAVLVAGSWHKSIGEDKKGNIAPVLNGRGEVLLEFGKNQRFKFGEHVEDIEQSGTIHVLVAGRELIAFTICKDFCDLGIDMPVLKLDADLVLVPSMGRETTMRSHLVNMEVIKIRHGARAFIVQQMYPSTPGDPSIGYAFFGPVPTEMKASELAISQSFTTFPH